MQTVGLEFVSVFVEGILLAIAPVLATMVAAWVLAQAKLAWSKLKQVSGDYSWALDVAAEMAVKAAEQSEIAGYIKEKKEFALELAERYLTNMGFKIDIALIDAAIEAAVLDLFDNENRLQENQEKKK